jgi:nucleoside-triphosphatase
MRDPARIDPSPFGCPAMPEPSPKNLLLTGPPACGKTTAILRLVERLSDLRLAGFYTAEVREHGNRVGFEAIAISTGLHATLAHVRSKSRVRVGRYGVETSALVPLVAAELKPGDVDLFVVDEIGKMELFCGEFVDAVRCLLDGPVPVVATVAMRGGGLIAEVKARQDVRLVRVTEENRNQLPGELEGWVRGGTNPPSCPCR